MRRRLIICLLVAPLLTGILALWLSSSETALQWAAKKLTDASNGTVTMSGLSGSLSDKLTVRQLRYQTSEQIISIKNAELAWSPMQLLSGRIKVDSLTASSATIERLKPSDEPFRLPKKLKLPLDVHIDRARIKKIAIVNAGSHTELRDLHFRFFSDKQRWQLQDLGFDSVYGKISGKVGLDTSRPFQLDGLFQITNEEAQANAVIGGNLEHLKFGVTLSGYGGTGHAELVAEPFTRTPLRALKLSAQGINPEKMQPEWPQASLKILMDAKVEADGILQGSINLSNSLHGQLEQHRLPFRSAKARLAGTIDAAQLNNVLLDFGSAGKFAGDSKTINGETVFTLRTQKINLNGISSKMKRTSAAGDIVLTSNGDRQTLKARLEQNQLRMDVIASRKGHALQLNQATLKAGKGELRLYGKMSLDDKKLFELAGVLRQFNPATLGAYPGADMNLNFALQGNLAPDWQLALRYEVQQSNLLSHSLSGRGTLKADAKRIHGIKATLSLGSNRLSANGNLGLPADRLQWQIDAPKLDVLGQKFKGALKGKGVLGGTRLSPYLSMLLEGKELMLHGYSAKTLYANINLDEGKNGPLHADIQLDNAVIKEFPIPSLTASASGLLRKHTLKLGVTHKEGLFNVQAEGGWHSEQKWSGTIDSLQNQGKYAFLLKHPATFEVGAHGYSLQDLTLGLNNGEFRIETLKKTEALFSSRGSATGIPLSWLITLSPEIRERMGADLVMGANWALDERNAFINGFMHVFREAGDITVSGNSPTAFGLSEFDAQARITKNAIKGELKIAGKNVGTIQVAAHTRLSKKLGAWTLPKQSPMHLDVSADMPALSWLGWMSADQGVDVDGKLALKLSGSGTIGNPRFYGNVVGDNLGLHWAEQGVYLHDGILRAQLHDNRMQIQQATFKGTEGTLQIEGSAQARKAQVLMDMRLIADKFMLMSRPDRQLVVSGESTLSLDQKRLHINGKLYADRARLELPEHDEVVVSEDVVVIGQEQKLAQEAMPIGYDLEVDLGSDFRIKGKGINALLSGSLRVFSTQNQLPNARGTIQVAKGTYKAYGQKLEIRRGLFTFSDTIDNPALNILAVRKAPNRVNAVEAGILISGTAQSPLAKLVSTPAVPDTEKLSWLVLGRGTDMTSQKDFNALGAAAGALFGSEYAASLQSRLGATFGVDEFGVSNTEELDNSIMYVGKRLSPRFYLIFEQSISGASSIAKLRYLLSRRLTVEVGAGTMSALDIIYNMRFD